MIKLSREIQIPIDDVDFSKNNIFVEVTAETYTDASKELDTALADQMGKFKTGLQELKDYDKMQKLTQLFTKLLNWPLWPQIQTEIARIKASNVSS